MAQGSFPHPVIGNVDDVASTFEIAHASVTPTTQDVELKFRIRMDDPDLTRMLDEAQAKLVFRWDCGSTLSRGTLEATPTARHMDGTTWVTSLDQQDIANTVSVEVLATAASDIEGYTLARQHPDYLGQSFSIQAGDILGTAGSFSFEADKLYDPLSPPIGSCFRFVEDATVRRGLRVTFNSDDQVTVAMSAELLTGLHSYGDFPEAQISLVVLPALMETLAFMRSNEGSGAEDVTDKQWYRAVLDLANSVGSLQGDSILDLSQRILDYPI